MALPWWLATTACAPSSGSLGLGGWLAFLFLSPCPQRALLGAVDLVFLAASLIFAARRPRSAKSGTAAAPEREALLQEPKPSPPLFRCALALALAPVAAPMAPLSLPPARGAVLSRPPLSSAQIEAAPTVGSFVHASEARSRAGLPEHGCLHEKTPSGAELSLV